MCVRHPNLTYRPTNDTIYLTGNEGQNICGIFSEIAAFVSYGVKQKLKSRYANKRWAYFDQTAPFRAGDVSEVTCRIRAMSKSYLLAAALVYKNQLGPDFDKFRACVTQINMQALLCACVYMTDSLANDAHSLRRGFSTSVLSFILLWFSFSFS